MRTTTTQTRTLTTELLDACADGARRARAVLRADGAALVRPRVPAGLEVLATDHVPGFDIEATLSAALLDVLTQSPRTLTRGGPHSIVLAPIVTDRGVVAALQLARRGSDFTADELPAVEAVAREFQQLFREHLGVDDSGRRTTLSTGTIKSLLGADSESVDWVEDIDGDDSQSGTSDIVVAFGPLMPSNPQERSAMTKVLTHVLDATEGHVAAIVVGADPIKVLGIAATPRAPDLPADRLISKTIVGQVMESGLPVLTLDAPDDELGSSAESILTLDVATVMCIPLIAPRQVHPSGVLYSATFRSRGRFTPETLEMIMADARTLAPTLASL